MSCEGKRTWVLKLDKALKAMLWILDLWVYDDKNKLLVVPLSPIAVHFSDINTPSHVCQLQYLLQRSLVMHSHRYVWARCGMLVWVLCVAFIQTLRRKLYVRFPVSITLFFPLGCDMAKARMKILDPDIEVIEDGRDPLLVIDCFHLASVREKMKFIFYFTSTCYSNLFWI